MSIPVNFISKILEIFKLSFKLWLALFISTSYLLFFSDSFFMVQGLYYFTTKYNSWIAAIWLISAAIIISHILSEIAPKITNYLFYILVKRPRYHAKLRNLTPKEKLFLSNYLLKNTKTQDADYSDGVVAELTKYSIIYQASCLSQVWYVFPYNIQSWAWKYLHKHPEIVGLSSEDIGSKSK